MYRGPARQTSELLMAASPATLQQDCLDKLPYCTVSCLPYPNSGYAKFDNLQFKPPQATAVVTVFRKSRSLDLAPSSVSSLIIHTQSKTNGETKEKSKIQTADCCNTVGTAAVICRGPQHKEQTLA